MRDTEIIASIMIMIGMSMFYYGMWILPIALGLKLLITGLSLIILAWRVYND